jgi:flagellar hook-associated protein 1 FlgK
MDKLDTLAATIINEVNNIHLTGYGLDGVNGRYFFDPNFTSASDIRMNTQLSLAPEKIGASGSGEEGDGSVALAIQSLRNERLMIGNTTTVNDFYNSIIGTLGVETHQAMSLTENYELSLQQVKNARESVQGVSLDEEMTNMIKYQHAYDAAARVITTMDEALDVVISRMGIVGR